MSFLALVLEQEILDFQTFGSARLPYFLRMEKDYIILSCVRSNEHQVPQGPRQTFPDGFSMGSTSQDFLGDDFKSQGSHVPYNVTDFSTQASQSGYAVDYVTHGTQGGYPGNFLNQNSQPGYSRFGAGNDFMSQDYMTHGSHGLFTQAGFTDPSQDDATQSHFGVPNANPLQSQGMMNSLYSQPFAHYNTQPLNLPASQPQPQQGQGSQNQKMHYAG